MVFPGSSPITAPLLLRKRTRSEGPLLRRHYPASTLLRPSPSPGLTIVLADDVGGANLHQSRVCPNYPDHLPDMACSLPRWIVTGALVGSFPDPRALPHPAARWAAPISLPSAARASLVLRPARV